MKIAVLIGGSGRSLKNFIDLGNQLAGHLQCVVAHKEVAGLQFAKDAGIPYYIGIDVYPFLESHHVDLAVMAGWIKKLSIPHNWTNRVMNIHPALLPAFGGQDMYGHHVHEAVIQSGAKFSGCTVHYADNEYDHGPIILQKVVPVLDDDTPDTLAARVFEQEKIAYPEAIHQHMFQ
jgi:phosphoribosylglycinamide formyltransferase 1